MVPHEEYGTPTLHDDPMLCSPFPLEQHFHPQLLFYVTYIHGCTSLSHLDALSLIDGGYSSIAWMRELMMRHVDTSCYFCRIMGHGILTYVIGEDMIGYLVLVYIWHMMV